MLDPVDLEGYDARASRRYRISETLVTAPSSDPIDVGDLKAHSRIQIDDDDALIENVIAAARRHLESYTGMAFMTQTWDLFRDEFPSGDAPIYLRHAPVQSITSVTYVDADGVTQTHAAADRIEELTSHDPMIVPAYDKDWPATRDIVKAVTIRVVCGYTSATAVPEEIRLALRLLAAHWYDRRDAAEVVVGGDFKAIPFGVRALLAHHRRGGRFG